MIDISFQQDQYDIVPTLVQSPLIETLKARAKAEMARGNSATAFPKVHELPIDHMFHARLASFDPESEDAEAENAFYVADLGEVYRQHQRWKALLPRIEPFFAMKCNPDPMVMRLLASLGTGFDCASKNEIQSVLDMGVDPSRIIYANPCKQNSFVKYAYQNKVRMMTFDNAEELYKIKKFHPEAQLVLRILTDDSKSLCKLGLKFGAPLDTTGSLLETAQALGLDVIGISFHVGSGCFDANAFGEAVIRARRVFDQAKSYGFDFKFLDVGGGFPSAHVTEGITFEKVASILGSTVDALFEPDVRVIAEPGRYYVGSAFTLATQVIARRTIQRDLTEEILAQENQNPSHMYYINDGMYGSFNCIMFDHQICEPKVLLKDGEFAYKDSSLSVNNEPLGIASVWGPTCDSIDCISAKAALPLMETGDWLYFDNMGAYTITAASQFNGFRKSEILYTTTEPEVSFHF
ncbi:ornithine decarboxylase [Entomortierella parvispora]|uniref:ornithine decarboxylase n=1 Tax=Entomortierella parvispora TaxID=205924 RepID=A0A9P3H4A0_9FUNG|nr:ornithine decarboxylase [Entomortierella parvispora]